MTAQYERRVIHDLGQVYGGTWEVTTFEKAKLFYRIEDGMAVGYSLTSAGPLQDQPKHAWVGTTDREVSKNPVSSIPILSRWKRKEDETLRNGPWRIKKSGINYVLMLAEHEVSVHSCEETAMSHAMKLRNWVINGEAP